MRFQPRDRVLVMDAPRDVQVADSATVEGRGRDLFRNLPGTVVAISGDNYRVNLDVDLEAAEDHGWITNNYTIHGDDLIPEYIPPTDDEIAETLASIQQAVRSVRPSL